MRAVVIHAAEDLRIERHEVGSVGPGQVKVRIERGGICGSDLHYFNHGGFGKIRLREPMVLGHEIAGTVQEVASDVTRVVPGDRVAVNPSRPCGACAFCLDRMPNHCSRMRFYGSAMSLPHVQGGFRDELVCDAAQCEKGSNVSTATLALAEPFAVAMHALARSGSVLGKRVLVTGCGPIGALVVAAAHFHGAGEIIVTDTVDEPLAIGRTLGADRTVNVAKEPDGLAFLKANKGQAEVMFECSGNEAALRDGLDAMRPRGLIVQVGLGDGDCSIPLNLLVAKELALQGTFRFHSEFGMAVRLIDSGKVDLSPIITGSFPVEDARAAFVTAGDRRRAMKVQLAFANDAV